MEQELTCYKYGKNGQKASECRSKADILPTWAYCHRVGCTVENCFVKRSNEAVEKQDVRFSKNNEPTKAEGYEPSWQNTIMFVKEGDPFEEENTVAAFKRSADGGTLTKQQMMQNDINAYTKTQMKPKIAVRTNPEFPITRKAPKKSKKRWKH